MLIIQRLGVCSLETRYWGRLLNVQYKFKSALLSDWTIPGNLVPCSRSVVIGSGQHGVEGLERRLSQQCLPEGAVGCP